jgi:hypothetical protein
MPSTLTWIDHDSKARERTLRILSLFQEKESRDELGLGAVRDSFADQLFPGTSTIQTRLRYMMFVPWIYRSMEDERVSPSHFAEEADRRERDLVQPLIESTDASGVFGKTAGRQLKRLPSSVYWAGLGAWGIRRTPFSQDEYHRRIGEVYRNRDSLRVRESAARSRDDELDPGERMSNLTWHPRLPQPPADFPGQTDFSLCREEADFILDRLQDCCPDSLLTFLAAYSSPADTKVPWEHPDYATFSNTHKEVLNHARLFSEVMHGASVSYNVQLAALQRNEVRTAEHRARFDEWVDNLPLGEIRTWSLDRLWELTDGHGHAITPKTKRFIGEWTDHVRRSPETLLDNGDALRLIQDREKKLKGPRSRFTNTRALEQWGGSSGIGRLTYRWANVKVLLKDLYHGLHSEVEC